MNRPSAYRALLGLFFAVLLLGCEEGPLKFSVRYDSLGALRANAPVYWEDQQIGQIEKVVSTDAGDFLVEVAVDPQHKMYASENSRFFILDDPEDPYAKALIIKQSQAGGALLTAGSIVEGEQRQGIIGNLMTSLKESGNDAAGRFEQAMERWKRSLAEQTQSIDRQLEETLDELGKSFEDFSKRFADDEADAEVKKLQESLDDFIQQFNSASEDIQDQIREEILPQLRRDLEALKERLQKQRRGEEVEKMENRLIEI